MPPVSKVAMGKWPRAQEGKSEPKLRDLVGLGQGDRLVQKPG